MKIRCLLFLLCLVFGSLHKAPAQSISLSVDQAQDLLVRIVAAEDTGSFAGTILGYRADSLYIVTARHVVGGRREFRIHLTSQETFPANLVTVSPYPTLDYAVLAAAAPRLRWRIPRAARRRYDSMVEDERLFVLGCPRGDCWDVPQRAEFWRFEGPMMQLRSTFLEAGHSGGPVVDLDGAVVGMVTHADGISGHAIDWPYLIRLIARENIPHNLEQLMGLRTRSLRLQVLPTLYPERAQDYDGVHLAGGASLEGAIVFRPWAQLALSIHRISIYNADYHPNDDASVLVYNLGIGYRATVPNPAWSLGRRARDAITMGFDLLIPTGYARVMGTFYGDSIDTQHGERVLIRDAFPGEVEGGWMGHLDYGISASENIWIQLRFSVLQQEIEFIERYRPYLLFNAGVEWRIPF